jgi:hypothetical protein
MTHDDESARTSTELKQPLDRSGTLALESEAKWARSEAALGAAPGESTNRRLREPFWSGRPGSNRRPLPWQGNSAQVPYLPIQAFPQFRGSFCLDRDGHRRTTLAMFCCTFAARRGLSPG